MDDDIDIEEHDVLDNPRIKSMFPDLSRVKIEAPDDEVEEETEEDLEQNQLLYQYDYASITEHSNNDNASVYDNTDNIYNDDNMLYDNADCDENTDNFYNEEGNMVLQYDNSNSGDHTAMSENPDIMYNEQDTMQYDSVNSVNNPDNFNNASNEDDPAEYDNINHENTENIESIPNEQDMQYNNLDPENNTEISEYDSTYAEQNDLSHNQYAEMSFSHDNVTVYEQNPIILGSKPTYEALVDEAINIKAVVCVEDWGFKLAASRCYCKDCKTLFPTVNALDAHKMVAHSFLVAVSNNTARKSTGSNYYMPATQSIVKKPMNPVGKLCNHCNSIFPDDTTLIKHLYELLPMSNFDSNNSVASSSKVGVASKQIIKTVSGNVKSDSVKRIDVVKNKVVVKTEPEAKVSVASSNKTYYKCILCQEVLRTQYSLRVHRNLKHSMFVKKKIFIPYKPHKSGKGKIDGSYIPKSTLMQCGKCQIHLLSPIGAVCHYASCSKNTTFIKCLKCHRRIISKDVQRHMFQHDNTDKFKVYTVTNKSFYERTLCRCPKCDLCLEELTFWRHVKQCTPVDFEFCQICNINVAKKKTKSHRWLHIAKKYTKKDFYLIEFFNKNPSIVKRDVDAIKPIVKDEKDVAVKSVVDKRKIVKTTKVDINDTFDTSEPNDSKKILYYCQYCECCLTVRSWKCHSDKLCAVWGKNRKRFCEKCGLQFSSKTYLKHKYLHDRDNFNITDYCFVDFMTGISIDPPIRDNYTCENCNIVFINLRNYHDHTCNDSYTVCQICNKKYYHEDYEIHKQFHVTIMPELIMKYNSLFSTWNLIFMCVKCRTACLTYDSAVEHSQKHLTFYMDTSMPCQYCKLNIHESDYRTHNDLHKENKNLKVKSFKILEFDYKKLFNDDWVDFDDLSKDDIDVVLNKSVYKDVRNVKMTVTGTANDVKYICNNCKTSVDDVQIHLESNCPTNTKYSCKYCNIKIIHLENLVVHESKHEKITKEFKIVTFNDENDALFNKKLNCGRVDKDKKYKLFKCQYCSICVHKQNTIHHRCRSKDHHTYCQICDKYFSKPYFRNHQRAHEKLPNLSKKTISITYFAPALGNKMYKQNNITAVKQDTTPAKQNRINIGKHNEVPTAKDSNAASKQIVNEDTTLSILYKSECGLHFNSKSAYYSHTVLCKNVCKKIKCPKCHLSFAKGRKTMANHIKNHQGNFVIKNIIENTSTCLQCGRQLTNEEIKLHVYTCRNKPKLEGSCKKQSVRIHSQDKEGSEETAANDGRAPFILYKCNKCDIHFWNLKCYKTHAIYNKHAIKRKKEYCTICHLYFSRMSYKHHMAVHENRKEFKLKIVQPYANKFKYVEGKNPDSRNRRKRKLDTLNVDESNEIKRKRREINDSTPNVDIVEVAKDRKKVDVRVTLSYETKKLLKSQRSKRNNILYQCFKCPLLFFNLTSVNSHLNRHSNNPIILECDQCGLKFTATSLSKHIYLHHNVMKLKSSSDFNIKKTGMRYNSLYKTVTKFKPCVMAVDDPDGSNEDQNNSNTNDIESDRDLNDGNTVEVENAINNDPNDINSEVDLDNGSNDDLSKSNVEIEKPIDVDSTVNVNNENTELITNSIAEIRLYKCGKCNICFIEQAQCLQHVQKHVAIDSKYYISCKICGYQFLVDCLKIHMERHHEIEFKVDNVLIEEYTGIDEDMSIKIEVYHAVDRVQSRLVSTTTDDKDS